MTDVDLKNALLAGDPTAPLDETEEVKTHAGVVVVRGLSRGEVLKLNGLRDTGELLVDEWEQALVSKGIVTPTMTPAEVAKWQDVEKAGGALKDVTDAIVRLSKLDEGASKSGVRRTRGQRRSRV